MSHPLNIRFKLRPLAWATSAALMSLAGQPAHALNDEKYWACPNTAAWTAANCWRTNTNVTTTPPDTGDFVYLDNTTTTAKTVTFGINPGKTYKTTNIQASYTGNMTLNVNSAASNFKTDSLDIATASSGSAGIAQSARTVTVTSERHAQRAEWNAGDTWL